MKKNSIEMIKRLQRMNPAQLYYWLLKFYRDAYEEGLREGEQEFDDAVIITEDEAKEFFSVDKVDELLNSFS